MASLLPWQSGPVAAAAKALSSGRSFLDASDTGTGKTFVAAFAAKEIGARVGVICPLSVIEPWKAAVASVGVEPIFIRNIESLKGKSGRPWLRRLGKRWVWDIPDDVVLIFDEVHRFAGQGTQNAAILASAPRPTLMLSRTVAESPLGLRAVGHQLGLTTWSDWWRWCLKNGCVPGEWGGLLFTGGLEPFDFSLLSPEGQLEVRKPFLDRLHRQVFRNGCGVRVRVSELGDAFPDNLVEAVEVPVRNLRVIDKAYHDAVEAKSREDGVIPITQLLYARQQAEAMKVACMAEMALDAIAEGMTVALFVNFSAPFDMLVGLLTKALGDGSVAVIRGGQTAEEREFERQLVQTDKARAAVVMTSAGGVGLSLQDVTGRHPRLGLHSPGLSARDLVQALGRLPRVGAKSKVVQKIVFAAGTVESLICRQVQAKAGAIDTLNDGDLLPPVTRGKSKATTPAHAPEELALV